MCSDCFSCLTCDVTYALVLVCALTCIPTVVLPSKKVSILQTILAFYLAYILAFLVALAVEALECLLVRPSSAHCDLVLAEEEEEEEDQGTDPEETSSKIFNSPRGEIPIRPTVEHFLHILAACVDTWDGIGIFFSANPKTDALRPFAAPFWGFNGHITG